MKLSNKTKFSIFIAILMLVLIIGGVDMLGVAILTGILAFIYAAGSFIEYAQQGYFSNYTYTQILRKNFEGISIMWGSMIVVFIILIAMNV